MCFEYVCNFNRDVAWLGLCDDGCIALADGLGWKVQHFEFSNYESVIMHEDINFRFSKSFAGGAYEIEKRTR